MDTENVQLPQELLQLTTLIDEKPELLASGDDGLRKAALQATEFIFNSSLQTEADSLPHINDLVNAFTAVEPPRTRSQTKANGKRKRTPSPPPSKVTFQATPLTSLYTDGFDEDQIWAQLEIRLKNICNLVEVTLNGDVTKEGDGGEDSSEDDEDSEENDRLQNILEALQKGEVVSLEGLGLDGLDGDEEEENEVAESEEEDEEEEDQEEHVIELHESSSEEEEEEDDKLIFSDSASKRSLRRGQRSKGYSKLNDGFFDLDEFNAEIEEAEAIHVSRGRLDGDDEESSDDNISVDLFAPVDNQEQFDEEDLENDPGEAYYKDFFEPPSRRTKSLSAAKSAKKTAKSNGAVRFHDEVRVKNIKAKGKNLPLSFDDNDADDLGDDFGEGFRREDSDEGMDEERDDVVMSVDEDSAESDDGENGRVAIERLKDDLFAEDEVPQEDLTTHEKRMRLLREQITALEAENVGEKDWVLMGEATSRSRPQNSVLEEDLEFDRMTKAVPVVTEEKIHTLEERIKARIMEGRYDDVVRIRPIDDKPFLPSRLLELSDKKSTQSLAQIYENEYMAAQTGEVVGDDRDGKLKKEHEEIEQIWEKVCAKLDALSNAHFVPKQPKAIISTIPSVSTTALESALPTTKSVTTMLAPEEVFAPSSSELRAKSEMTPTEKRALRHKARKARKQTRDILNRGVDKFAKLNSVKKQKQAALESVVKTGKGVTVVGKRTKDVLKTKGKKGKS